MSEYCDLALNSQWQMMGSANGDLLVTDDARMQDISLEAMSPQGSLFYNSSYGWGLEEFTQRPSDALLQLEVLQRIRLKLAARDDVDLVTLNIQVSFGEERMQIALSFRFIGEDELQQLALLVTPLEIEVITID